MARLSRFPFVSLLFSFVFFSVVLSLSSSFQCPTALAMAQEESSTTTTVLPSITTTTSSSTSTSTIPTTTTTTTLPPSSDASTTTIPTTTTATSTTTSQPASYPFTAVVTTKPIPFEVLPQVTSAIRKDYSAKISDQIESTGEGGYRFEAYFQTVEIRAQFVDDATQNKVRYVKSAEKKGGDDDDDKPDGKPDGSSDDDSDSKKTYIIVGASVGGVAVLAAVAGFIVYQKRTYDKRNGNIYTQV